MLININNYNFIMNKSDKYILHCSGLYAMLAWINEQKNQGLACKVNNQIIYSHPLAGRLFSLGISKNKNFSKDPFLAIQPNENKWFSLVQWEKICVRERDLHLYFVAGLVKGNETDYPDIPPFIFAVSFDSIEKIKILNKLEKIDGREYRMDEDGSIKINFHSKIFSLPVEKKQYEEPIIDFSGNYTSYADLMRQKESYLQQNFQDGSPPEFKGDTSLASESLNESSSFFEKMKKKWL